MDYFMGIDLHKKYLVSTIVDEKGTVIRTDRVSTDEQAVRRFIESLDGERPGKCVMEACYNWSYLYDLLENDFEEVVLAHPYKTKAIAEARIKTDKIDSETLAQLLRADLIARSYAPDKETRNVRNLLRSRAALVSTATAFKNRVHAILSRNHVDNPALKEMKDIFSKKGMNILNTVPCIEY